MSMNMNMPKTVYWYKNQVAIMYQTDLSPQAPTIAEKVTSFRKQLNSQVLDKFNLLPYSVVSVQPPMQQEVANAAVEVDDLDGVYLFGAPKIGIDQRDRTAIIIFYHVAPKPDSMQQENTGMNGMGNDGMVDNTLAVIDQLQKNRSVLQNAGVTSFDAMPHWFSAGTDETTHGCPVSPPIPIEDGSTSGKWKLALQQLSDPSLQDKTGDGVTVFVLDTLPSVYQIMQAASVAGSNNMLLQDMFEQSQLDNGTIKFTYQDAPDPSQTAFTGKDVYGRLVGFPMPDHGLFIAGIIHDLAPNAKIECIRVLNDCAVGDLITLANTLNHIHDRMLPSGNLYNKPVVINMSLVVGPPEGDLSNVGLNLDTLKADLRGFNTLLQSLVDLGAIFVASAGNDTDPRDMTMNPNGLLFGPRYPAAFAYDDVNPITTMIPVAALNGNGEPASYSNHPGPKGIATYGGETPTIYPPSPDADPNITPEIDPTVPIDALCGVYSATMYPALTEGNNYDPSSPSASTYPLYPSPNTNAWAYWSGTSFATPIISALTALSLQGQTAKSEMKPQGIMAAATQQVTWTGCGSDGASNADVSSPAITATQDWQSSN